MPPILAANAPVLVVEDDLFFSVRIETTLKKMGFAPTVVMNGEKALEQATAIPPALVIINFGSERLSPAEVVRKLKALPDPAPVLGFISHTFMPQVRPNAMAAGCDLLIANSALMMRLPQIIEKIVAKQELTAEDTEEDG